MMTPYPRYKAPSLDPHKALLLNQLLSRGHVWETPFGQGKALWESIASAPAFTPACAVEFTLGNAAWTAYVSDASCIFRHEAFGTEQDFTLDDLPVEVRCAVLHSLLLPTVDTFQQATGQSLAITNIDFAPANYNVADAIGLKLRLNDGQPADMSLLMALVPHQAQSASAAAHLFKDLPLRPNPRLAGTVASLPLEVALETGYLYLTSADVASLEVEDMLLPEAWPFAQGKLNIRVNRGLSSVLIGTCSVEQGQAVLEGTLAVEAETGMENNEQKDIEIRLSFELDRRVITVGELASLTPGFTFPIARDSDSVVTVRAQGKAIARGRIVDINGTLGVQLTELL